jgi:hypothetical protein
LATREHEFIGYDREVGMSWDIKVWHEDLDDRVRLVIEAGDDIPDEVISAIAGSYWLEEVQYVGGEWDEPTGSGQEGDRGPRIHG